MDVLELTRLQFAVTTLYHYLFVPLSISLSTLTAVLQTAAVRTGRADFQRLALLVGKILMATFAVGVVTGLVQEFQFGLGWSDFARFYGDVFGPTLALEGMLAFFLEATFLGLWYFGRDKLPRLAHLATIWVVAVGTLLSAFIILAANAFMQNPVGYTYDEEAGRAHLESFSALLLNEVNLAAFPHTVAGAFMGGGSLLLAVALWGMSRRPADTAAWRTLGRLGAWTTVLGGAGTAVTGDALAKVMTHVQPMKMAAAEALYASRSSAPFSVFAYAPPGEDEPSWSLEIPGLLSFLGKGSFGATISGMGDLQSEYAARFGAGDYVPWVPVAFWSFRLMIGVGLAAAALAAAYLWLTRKGRPLPVPRALSRLVPVLAFALPLLPAAANSFGWVFTETARQPWLVFGLFRTEDGVSLGLTSTEVLLSLGGFALVYGLLALAWARLVQRLLHAGLPPEEPAPAERDDAPVPALTY
ncbi:cytochrome ubiquinol oxidase subunit I [Motilibacter aurantiacus]|uniref:cytochrome ubiquinol oxidase subunit I n=1 Tax=Motilibacter aurantiacus TaxID=2714955 RepID=UPI00140DD6A0|nr:cytochrome ubiquinol oxidase subunit I [Motilibacter aurantiacus]NHC46679.1 cytochrome ubiquinol oxidase subunit I [Motilibacter aurantiacus]